MQSQVRGATKLLPTSFFGTMQDSIHPCIRFSSVPHFFLHGAIIIAPCNHLWPEGLLMVEECRCTLPSIKIFSLNEI